MTILEAQDLVMQEIEARFRNLTDAQSGDWTRAFMRCTREQALGIIHDLLDHPAKGLTLKQFIRALPVKPREDGEGASRMGPAYEGWIMCVVAPAGHEAWQGRRWPVPMIGQSAGDQEIVGQYASLMARQAQEREGGRWSGVVQPTTDEIPEGAIRGPRAAKAAASLILDGPDTPGRRWLVQRQGKGPVAGLEVALSQAVAEREPGADADEAGAGVDETAPLDAARAEQEAQAVDAFPW